MAERQATGSRQLALAPALAAILVSGLACGRAERQPETEVAREPVEARASVDRAVATTGDVITYRVVVDREPELRIALREPGAEIGGFRIIDAGAEPEVERRGREVEERWYRLRADLVGSYVLPPLEIRFGPADGELTGAVETSAIFVEVESVLGAAGEAQEIRGLKPLRRTAAGPPWGWIAGAGALAAVLAIAGLWWWRGRRRAPSAPPVPAHEIAFAALDRLRRMDLDDADQVRRFHFGLSEIVRAYIEGRFGLNATDLTTEEILARRDRLPSLDHGQARELERFLLDTDQVKFAEYRPRPEEIEATYERALRFVEETRPRPEPEAGEEEALAA